MRDEINVEKLRRMNVNRNRTDVENVLLKEMVEKDIIDMLNEADESAIDAIVPENVNGDSLFGDSSSVNDDELDTTIISDDDDPLGEFNMVEI